MWLVRLILVLSMACNLLAQEIRFTDVSLQAGVSQPGVLTESVAWGDYDGDGDLDLYLTNMGPNKLLRNDGNDRFTDVTNIAGVGNDLFSVGAVFGDLDQDGDLDLYVVNFQAGNDVLYRNEGSSTGFRFTDITVEAGVTAVTSSRGVAMIDYDNDGLLDLYVNAIGDDIFYHNQGDMRFVSKAAELGINASAGQGVGVVATDINKDGWIDLYTGNRSGDLSNLYLNNGGQGFTDVAQQAGITASGLGMGVLAFDYDNDLDMDLYWTTWPGDDNVSNALYRNNSDGSFTDVAGATGTTDTPGWGISCNAGDIDNDGWQDFFVTNGFSPDTSPNVLFRNQAGASFEDITEVIGGGAFDGRGVAFADYDQDGDLDLLVTGGPGADTRLWRNDTNNSNHFLSIELKGIRSNPHGVGARIEVRAGDLTMMKEVSGGAGRGSFNALPVSFGLGKTCNVDSVEIFWPSGATNSFENIPGDQFILVEEPVGIVPTGYETVSVASRGSCDTCDASPSMVAPWIVNNSQWSSRIAIFNRGDTEAEACLRAVDQEGQVRDAEIRIPAKGLFAIESGDLFAEMSGYALHIASNGSLSASFLTFNKESASGRSPAMTTATKLAGLTSNLLFGYTPGLENPAIVITAPLLEGFTTANVSLHGSSGLIAEKSVVINGKNPYAILVSELFEDITIPDDASLMAVSEDGVLLAGSTFVFNVQREPSMAKAESISESLR